MLSLVDVDAAVAELTRVLEADARIVCIKGGPAHSPTGLISPADPRFDPFWGLVNESGVTVGIHSGDAGYGRYLDDWEPTGGLRGLPALARCEVVLSADRPPFETMAALVCQGLFDRFPSVRVASIEAGADWATPWSRSWRRPTARCLRASPRIRSRRSATTCGSPPSTRTTWPRSRKVLGVDRLLFGSDWPHAEGLAEPRDFALDLRRNGFAEDEIRTIMADNGRSLTVRRN